jgi:hypothetical protein
MAECSFWSRFEVDPGLVALAGGLTRIRHTHRAFWWRTEKHPDLQRFLAGASEFYHHIAGLTGCSVIVDSSKSPALAALLSRAPELEVHMVHMVRDLRGVVSSRRVSKRHLSAASPRRSVLKWYWTNAGAEALKHRAAGFSQLRYEDLVANPKLELEQLASAIRGLPVLCPFLRDGEAFIHPQHLVLGNPDKSQCGEIPFREPRCDLGFITKTAVSIAGAPLLMRYGYLPSSSRRDSMGRNSRANPTPIELSRI